MRWPVLQRYSSDSSAPASRSSFAISAFAIAICSQDPLLPRLPIRQSQAAFCRRSPWRSHLRQREPIIPPYPSFPNKLQGVAESSCHSRIPRRLDLRQTKKGNQWHFGMKAHIGVDAETGLAHRVLHGGEAQGVGAGEGGASIPVREAALRLPQGAVPGSGEEQAAHRAAARVHEPAGGWTASCGGLTWGWCARRPQNATSAA